MFIQKLPQFLERLIQFGLLRRRDARIRHRPIGDEISEEKTFGETKLLRPRKKQLFCLLNFFLSLTSSSLFMSVP